MKLNIIILLFLVQTGCSQSKPSTQVNYDITELLDIAYLAEDKMDVDSLQRLNLILPDKQSNCPLLIWIGGGAWAFVDRHKSMEFARHLARKGIAVACIGHRLSPALYKDPLRDTGVEHPKHVEDVASSIKWLYNNAANYPFDKEQIFVGGYSSGGHLSALVSLDATYLENLGLSQEIIRGVIPISGAYDIVKYHDSFVENHPELAELHVKAAFGQSMKQLSQASPTSYIDKDEIPLLIITDNQGSSWAKPFEDKLIEKEYTDFQIIYDYSRTHAALWKALSTQDNMIYRDLIVDFIKSLSQQKTKKNE